MTLTEKVAYLKGLIEGYEIKESSKEGKIMKAMSDILADMALSITDIEDEYSELAELIDEIDEDLGEVEQEIYCCEGDDDSDDEEDECYQIECSKCGEDVYLDEEAMYDGNIVCPNCGEKIEIEIDDKCSCGCCDCDDEEEHKD